MSVAVKINIIKIKIWIVVRIPLKCSTAHKKQAIISKIFNFRLSEFSLQSLKIGLKYYKTSAVKSNPKTTSREIPIIIDD